jgi:hypothetical protein
MPRTAVTTSPTETSIVPARRRQQARESQDKREERRARKTSNRRARRSGLQPQQVELIREQDSNARQIARGQLSVDQVTALCSNNTARERVRRVLLASQYGGEQWWNTIPSNEQISRMRLITLTWDRTCEFCRQKVCVMWPTYYTF